MEFRDVLRSAVQGITLKKGRSFLTMLGIIIGVGSVVLMTGIGASMEGVILGQISSIGARSMVLFPGKQEGPPGQASAGFDSLTFNDIEALEKLPTIRSLAPIVFIEGKTTYGTEEVQHTVMGTSPNFFSNQSITAASGRLPDEEDDRKAALVAMVGQDTAADLFGDADPLGKKIKIAGKSFLVIGVMKPVGSQFFQNFDERIFVPLSVARSITGRKYANYMTFQEVYGFDAAFADVRGLLRQRHGIENPEGDEEKDDFTVSSSQQANDILGTVSMGLTLFITLVAGISLIVGGIGIMNIMLVAVTERIAEIGLRKAVGATRRDILLQFLCEAVALTVFGGILGVILGIGGSGLIALIVTRFLSTYIFAISVPSMFVALLMAALTGLLFGVYPARRAASLSPMEALRYE